jgi:hypothetical protein
MKCFVGEISSYVQFTNVFPKFAMFIKKDCWEIKKETFFKTNEILKKKNRTSVKINENSPERTKIHQNKKFHQKKKKIFEQ